MDKHFHSFLRLFYSVVPRFGARAEDHGLGQLGKPINAEFSGFSFIVRFVCMLVNMRNYSDYSQSILVYLHIEYVSS